MQDQHRNNIPLFPWPDNPGDANPPPSNPAQDGHGGFFRPQPVPRHAAPPPHAPLPSQPVQSDDDGFFRPANPARVQQPPPTQPLAPPPYQGELQAPFQQFPPHPVPPGSGNPVTSGMAPPPGEEPPERIPYQAPRRQYSVMLYLYIGLGILVIILGAMGISQLMNNQQQKTAIVTISRQGSTYAGRAIIVRNESAYAQESVSMVKYVAEEGQTVSRGDPVCTVYTSGFNVKELASLQGYRKQIKEYLKILTDSSDTPDTRLQRLETTMLERAIETQALVRGASGNMINQEVLLKNAMAERYNYLKQKYPDDTKLTRLYDNESNQLQRIETWTKQFAASDNGLVSFYTDGLESALNINNYASYNPQEVRSMLDGAVPAAFERPKGHMDIYRLVRQYNWGVLMLAENLDWNPVPGETYQMLIESFDNTIVSATVESVTRSGGDLLVRLSVDSSVDPVLYVRSCHVQLNTTMITYAVPASAIVNKEGVIGVVVRFQEGDFIVPVTVISQDATQAHVVPENIGYLYEGLTVLLF